MGDRYRPPIIVCPTSQLFRRRAVTYSAATYDPQMPRESWYLINAVLAKSQHLGLEKIDWTSCFLFLALSPFFSFCLERGRKVSSPQVLVCLLLYVFTMRDFRNPAPVPLFACHWLTGEFPVFLLAEKQRSESVHPDWVN